jgi:hypothetical protein
VHINTTIILLISLFTKKRIKQITKLKYKDMEFSIRITAIILILNYIVDQKVSYSFAPNSLSTRQTEIWKKVSNTRLPGVSQNIDETVNDRIKDSIVYWTKEQLEEYSSRQGVILSLTTLGPAYRAIARAKHNETQIMGYIEGFVRPGNKLLHLDKMEVFRKMVKLARAENPNEFKGGGTKLGVGLLLGYLCLLHAHDQGCIEAEFLAIDDEPFQHKRLVKYYRLSGFEFVRYVGDDFKSIPDRLVWGGCGTLLRKDINYLLRYWSSLLDKSSRIEPNKHD